MQRFTIDPDQLHDALLSLPGVVNFTLVSRVVPQMTRKGNPFLGRVHKVVFANGRIGSDYDMDVRRAYARRGIESEFVAGPHAWGTYIDKVLITHEPSGRLYLRFTVKSRRERWYLDGCLAPRSMFAEFLRDRSDELVEYRNFAVDNVLAIRWSQGRYRLRQAIAPVP